MPSLHNQPLRPGDVVEVRSAAEILATLSGDGTLDRMPFMPEMIHHVGRRYRVTRRVDKICDTIAATGSRRMYDTVYLVDLRCDGSSHGGCQAGCKLYWKEAWLRRVDDEGRARSMRSARIVPTSNVSRRPRTRTVREIGGIRSEVWRCQATEAFNASEPLKTSDLRQYWREMTNGNFRLFRFIRLAHSWVLHGGSKPRRPAQADTISRPGGPIHTAEPLQLKPGDLVEVRSPTRLRPPWTRTA